MQCMFSSPTTQLETYQTHSNASQNAQAAFQAAQVLVGTGGHTSKETVRICTTTFPFLPCMNTQAFSDADGNQCFGSGSAQIRNADSALIRN